MTAAGLAVPFLDLLLNRDDLQRDAKRLFAIIRPDWDWDNVQPKALTGGWSNNMVAFHLGSDNDRSDVIVLRMPGDNTNTFNDYSRETEFMGIQFAIAAGCFQPLVAVFNNGIAYKYAHGRTLTRKDLDDPVMISKVTSRLVALHSMDSTALPLKNTDGKPCTFDVGKTVWSRIDHSLQQIPDEVADPARNEIFQKNRISRQEIIEEINKMKSLIGELNFATSPGHGDVHVKNIIFNENTDDIFILDYEMFGLHYEEYDIAFLFTSGPLLRFLGIYEPEDPDFSPDVRRQWICSYVDAKYKNRGLKNECIPVHVYDIVDIKCSIIETLVLLMQFVAGHMGLAIDLPMLDNWMQCFSDIKSRYFTAKEQLDGLKQRLLQLEQLN